MSGTTEAELCGRAYLFCHRGIAQRHGAGFRQNCVAVLTSSVIPAGFSGNPVLFSFVPLFVRLPGKKPWIPD